MTTVGDILKIALEIAPIELAEEWDNPGLLAGSENRAVTRALVALDLTHGVLREAKELGAELIVTHHPILFRARRNLREDDFEGNLLCDLIRGNFALIALHTNYDSAPNGLNDALAEAIGLTDVVPLEHGLRIGCYRGGDIVKTCEGALHTKCRVYGRTENIRRVAVCGGAGSDFAMIAKQAGADAYVTGEVRHHHALEAAHANLTLIEAGHLETERVAVKALKNALQMRADALQWNVCFMESRNCPFGA
ncbi:MAG: Nif3-like dinuclear metal center hexameric protein [Christensenellales bacterium]|jgi:dinuclear metal center YbgI/SA1388 family protein